MQDATPDVGGNRQIPRGLGGPTLLFLYVAIALSPLLLALIAGKPARNVWRELSAGLAMMGFACCCWNSFSPAVSVACLGG